MNALMGVGLTDLALTHAQTNLNFLQTNADALRIVDTLNLRSRRRGVPNLRLSVAKFTMHQEKTVLMPTCTCLDCKD